MHLTCRRDRRQIKTGSGAGSLTGKLSHGGGRMQRREAYV